MLDSRSGQNPPVKHHYIPVFYSKRWAANDGRLVVFSRPYKDVIDRWRHPDATGYQNSLYALRGFEPSVAHQMEELFFRPIDTRAADALTEMEIRGNSARWTSESRSAWTRFLLSLLTRCPDDIELFRKRYKGDLIRSNPYIEERYLAVRRDDDPPTFADWLKLRPEAEVERNMFQTFQVFIENEKMGSFINNLIWRVIDTSAANFRLLASDNPVIRTNGLQLPHGHMALPLGPRLLFVASRSHDFVDQLMQTPMRSVVMQCNRQVVRTARRFVYASDLSQAAFIRAQFGQQPEKRMMEKMLDSYDKGGRAMFDDGFDYRPSL